MPELETLCNTSGRNIWLLLCARSLKTSQPHHPAFTTITTIILVVETATALSLHKKDYVILPGYQTVSGQKRAIPD